MTRHRFTIVGIGEVLWDDFPDGRRLGGAPCNFAYHAGRLGCEAIVVSAVGNDSRGRDILNLLPRLGIHTEYVQMNDYPTGRVTVKLDASGVPQYVIHQHAAWDYISWESGLEALAKRSNAICFGSLAQRCSRSSATITSFLEMADGKCLKVFDVNLRQAYYQKKTIVRSLEKAGILKLNEEELPVVAGMLGYTGKVERLLESLMKDFELKLIAYTKGAKGSVLMTCDKLSRMDAPETAVVDTVGAGDAFTAMLVAGLLENRDLSAIHAAAVRLAAFVCANKGATPDIPKELLTFDQ